MKPFFYKSLLFLFAVIGAQIVIGRYFEFTAPIPEIKLIDTYLQKKYDVIYFGDSIIKTPAPDDKDTSSIIQMIMKINSSSTTVADLSHGAYHTGIYESYIEHISRSANKPKAIIIPINLESFSPGFDMGPGYQFEKETFLLTSRVPFINSFYRPLSIFGAVNANTVSWKKYRILPVYYKDTQVGVVQDFIDPKKIASKTPENIRDIYIYKYMHNLHPEHRKLVSLQNEIVLAHQAGIGVYVYITPINYEGGKVYVGSDFYSHIEETADMICAIAKQSSAPCLNLVFGLGAQYFNPSTLDVPAYPDGHLKQEGREFVAKEIYKNFLEHNDLFKTVAP